MLRFGFLQISMNIRVYVIITGHFTDCEYEYSPKSAQNYKETAQHAHKKQRIFFILPRSLLGNVIG